MSVGKIGNRYTKCRPAVLEGQINQNPWFSFHPSPVDLNGIVPSELPDDKSDYI